METKVVWVFIGRIKLEQSWGCQMKARPTRDDRFESQTWWNASLSFSLWNSKWRVFWRLAAAAGAPGPSCDSLSKRHSWLALMIETQILRRISPVNLPTKSPPASQPRARFKFSALDSAKICISLAKSGEMSPHGPATRPPRWRPPRSRKRETRGPERA